MTIGNLATPCRAPVVPPSWGRCDSEKRELQSSAPAQVARAAATGSWQYFNRPRPCLVESLEILTKLLHPETFRFGHEGTGSEWAADIAAGT